MGATGDPQVLLLSYDPIRILQYDDPHRQTMLNAWAVFKRKMEKLNDEIEERNARKENLHVNLFFQKGREYQSPSRLDKSRFAKQTRRTCNLQTHLLKYDKELVFAF